MMRRPLLMTVGMALVCGGVTATAAAQVPPPPPPPPPPVPMSSSAARDAVAAQIARGTAVVAGRVTTPGEPPAAVRRAIITLTDTASGASRSVLTGDGGEFTLAGVGAGRYAITASKPAHLTTAWGAKRPGRQGTTLVLADGQRVTDLSLTLPKGGVIAGRLTLPNGQPLTDTEVRVVPMRMAEAGGTIIDTTLPIRTDDEGRYRIYGLPPDRYLVAAYPIIGRGDFDPASAGEYDAVVTSLSRAVTGPPAATPTASRALAGFAPMYFPGTAVPALAVEVTLGLAEERQGVDFTVQAVSASSVSGLVLGVDGRPAPATQLSIEAMGPPVPLGASQSLRSAIPDADGRFTLRNMPPGSYRLTARSGGMTINPAGGFSSDTQRNTLWAMAEFTVGGQDLDAVTLQLREGETFSGRLVADGAQLDPDAWTRARVMVRPVPPPGQTARTTALGSTTRSTTVAADATFRVDGLIPGEYEVVATLPPALAGWHLAGVMHDGRDLRDRPLTFLTGSISGAQIVLSRAQASLSGRFSTESGAPVSDYFLVVFPDDQSSWHAGSPRQRVLRPGDDGRFTFTGLPPGDYRLAAVDDLEVDDHRRPAILETIYDSAIRVTVTAGAETRQDIRIR